MNRTRITGAVALLALLAAGSASADHGRAFGYAYARVIDVDPIMRRVVTERPRRECWQETEYRAERPLGLAGPTIAGSIIGAAIGRQFGSGSSRDALTLMGAAAGAAVANDRAQRNLARRGGETLHEVPVERCNVTVERVAENVVSGYWVTYRYRGRDYRTQMREHPGDRIALEISGRPVAYRAH